MKMSKIKKRLDEQDTVMCAHKRKDNKQVFSMGMVTKKKGQLLGINIVDKREE
jgi:hypothetical protein